MQKRAARSAAVFLAIAKKNLSGYSNTPSWARVNLCMYTCHHLAYGRDRYARTNLLPRRGGQSVTGQSVGGGGAKWYRNDRQQSAESIRRHKLICKWMYK